MNSGGEQCCDVSTFPEERSVLSIQSPQSGFALVLSHLHTADVGGVSYVGNELRSVRNVQVLGHPLDCAVRILKQDCTMWTASI